MFVLLNSNSKRNINFKNLRLNIIFFFKFNIIFRVEIFHFIFFDDDVIRAIQKTLNAKNVVIEIVIFYENKKTKFKNKNNVTKTNVKKM